MQIAYLFTERRDLNWITKRFPKRRAAWHQGETEPAPSTGGLWSASIGLEVGSKALLTLLNPVQHCQALRTLQTLQTLFDPIDPTDPINPKPTRVESGLWGLGMPFSGSVAMCLPWQRDQTRLGLRVLEIPLQKDTNLPTPPPKKKKNKE